jgi:hypothetical protein
VICRESYFQAGRGAVAAGFIFLNSLISRDVGTDNSL